MSKITIKDVAEKAGVSISTVSKVLTKSNLKAASPKTVELITNAALQLGYINKNDILSSNRSSYKIGIILAAYGVNKFTHNYYSNLYSYLESELHKNSCLIDFYYTMGEYFSSEIINDKIINSDIDALIIIDEYSPPVLDKFHKMFKPIINLSIGDIDNDGNDLVFLNSYKSIRTIVKRLIDSGRKKILFTSGDGNTESYMLNKPLKYNNVFVDVRTRAFLDELKANNIEIIPALIHEAPSWNSTYSYEKVASLIKSGFEFDAIFAADENLCFACYKALSDNNIKIPEQVSLISFDDVPQSFLSDIKITSLAIPKHEFAKTAVELLLLKLNGKLKMPLKIEVPMEFIKGETFKD